MLSSKLTCTQFKMATDVLLTKRFTATDYSSSLLQQLFHQKNERIFCDVILRVGDKQIHAHSNVLSAASSYFGAFLGRGPDSPRAFCQKTPQIIEIMIEGSGEKSGYIEAVSLIVDFMYSGEIKLAPNVISQVNEMAKIMKMGKILDFCKSFALKEDCVETNCHSVESQTEFLILRSIGIQTEKESKSGTPEKSATYMVDAETSEIASKCKKFFPKSKVYLLDMSKTKSDKMINNDKNKVPTKSESNGSSTGAVSETIIEEMSDIKTEPYELAGSNYVPTNVRFPQRKNRGKRPSKYLFDNSKYEENESDTEVKTLNDQNTENGCLEPHPVQLLKITNDGEVQSAKEIVYKCAYCPYSTNSPFRLKRHKDVHESVKEKLDGKEKIYKCERCDFTTDQYKYLQVHFRGHLKVINICRFCDYEAENLESLLEHQKIHKPPLRYHCPFCDNKYKTRAQLNVHLPKHLDVKPFVCEVCQMGFKWKHALKMHMTTHSSSKDHLCDVCGFRTAYRSQLKAHRLIHTGETFKCEFPNCKFQCIKKQSLKYHRLTHTQEKPHQCEICGQSFSLVKNLKRHALLHSDKRPYKCTFNSDCNFATTRYDKLKDHLLKIHGSGQPPNKKFRLSDYPKSLVPPPEADKRETTETPFVGEVIHIDSSQLNVEHFTVNSMQNKIYVQQPDGEVCPVTLVASSFDLPTQLITKLDG